MSTSTFNPALNHERVVPGCNKTHAGFIKFYERSNNSGSNDIESSKCNFDYQYLVERKFWRNPGSCIEDLIKEILNLLHVCETANLIKNDIKLSFYLEGIRHGLEQFNHIIERIHRLHPADSDAKNNALLDVYFGVCGLLHNSLKSIDDNQRDELQQRILQILCTHPICKQDAISKLDQFNIETLTEEAYRRQLQLKFNIATSALRRTISETRKAVPKSAGSHSKLWDRYLEAGCQVFVSTEVLQAKSPGSFNYSYHTKMIENTNQLIKEPNNQALKDKYQQDASACLDGKGSLVKQAASAMIVFAGIATAVGSIICSMTVAPGFVAPVGTVGGFMFSALGCLFFSASKDQGPRKAYSKFATASQELTHVPIFSNSRHGIFRAVNEQTPLLVANTGNAASQRRLVE